MAQFGGRERRASSVLRGMRHWVLVTAAFLLLAARAQEATDATEATASCSIETVRQPWDPVEFPAVFYADQNCPSEDDSTSVDDSAIWHARVDYAAVAARNFTADEDEYTHVANKTIGRLQRPSSMEGSRAAAGLYS